MVADAISKNGADNTQNIPSCFGALERLVRMSALLFKVPQKASMVGTITFKSGDFEETFLGLLPSGHVQFGDWGSYR